MTPETFLDGRVSLHCGDSRDVLRTIENCSIDSVVTDPPYALVSISKRFSSKTAAPVIVPEGGSGAYARASAGFMGKAWDNGETAFAVAFWREVYRTLKPGAHLIAFSGTRTYHRMVCAIEDAGFEIRDQIGWAYGSGFPKSHDVSKGIDKAGDARGHDGKRFNMAGCGESNGGSKFRSDHPDYVKPKGVTPEAQRWEGWGTALKPAWEPIVLARKPLIGTIAANVLVHGIGALNIDGCRVESGDNLNGGAYSGAARHRAEYSSSDDVPSAVPLSRLNRGIGEFSQPLGRWPANIIHDGSDEVVSAFPNIETTRSTVTSKPGTISVNGAGLPSHTGEYGFDESGSAARFFYTAKADSDDRLGSKHPTVKPVDLMQYLVRLITPKNGVCLDPFSGTGTTGEACFREGMHAVLIEREEEYQNDIRRRMALCLAGPDERQRESIKARGLPVDDGPLFGGSTSTRGGADRFTNTLPTRTNDWADRNEAVNE